MISHGIETVNLGQWIAEQLDTGYVFYDHGDSSRSNVAAIKGIFGDSVSQANRLVDVDIIIADSNKNAKFLIEIEERPTSPKRILGDVLGILMCNKFAVGKGRGQQYFGIDTSTRVIVAGVLPERGNRLKKVTDIIMPRIREMNALPDGVSPRNVSLIFYHDIGTVIEEVKNIIAK
jgi:hypothetical protein